MKRIVFLLALLLTLALSGAAIAAPGSAPADSFPDTIMLPDGFFPEGIVVGNGTNFYVGSLATGGVLRGDLRTGQEIAQSAGLTGQLAVGLDHDARTNLVYAAGGPGSPEGKVAIYNGETLELVANVTLTSTAGFVNDVIVTNEAAYLTDSFVPVMYRLGLDPNSGMPDPSDVSVIPLIGFVSGPDFNANGIVASANGQWLLIVNSSTGVLYRVDPATGISTPIDLGSYDVVSGDGMVLSGNTLYVVQNGLQQVSVFKMGSHFTTGTLLKIIELTDSETPTTADLFGSGLYVVDARFATPPGPSVAYEITRVAK